ncbi:hypothetical protein [Sporosarcina thermotolerans]
MKSRFPFDWEPAIFLEIDFPDKLIDHFPTVIDHFPAYIDHFKRLIDHFP